MGLRQQILIRELEASLARLQGGNGTHVQESATARETRLRSEKQQREERKAAREDAKEQLEETTQLFKRMGLSEAGAKAAAKGRGYRG